MSYSVRLDEKYQLSVADGHVTITRNGEEWLVNPAGSKAWISAADVIERLLDTDLKTCELLQKQDRNVFLVLEDRELNRVESDAVTFSKLANELAETHGIERTLAVSILGDVLEKLDPAAR